MKIKLAILGPVVAFGLICPALADYVIRDGNNSPQTVKAFNCSGNICPQATPAPSSDSGAATTAVPTTALAANQVLKASAGNLYGFQVTPDSTLSAAAFWVMVYDATSAPADGAVTPKKCYGFPAGTTTAAFSWPTPISFSSGIVVGVSTTGCFTKTASTHAFFSGDVK